MRLKGGLPVLGLLLLVHVAEAGHVVGGMRMVVVAIVGVLVGIRVVVVAIVGVVVGMCVVFVAIVGVVVDGLDGVLLDICVVGPGLLLLPSVVVVLVRGEGLRVSRLCGLAGARLVVGVRTLLIA